VTAEWSETVPGWYGKLPSLGDFASRRLPAEFIRTWDTWLQDVLQATRASLGERWLDCYLTMPIWRFVLAPGLVEASGWAGVLMPSVDRVGRQFPLTLAVALASDAEAAHVVFEGSDWFASLEDTALGVLDPARGPEDLDRALADCVLTSPVAPEFDAPVDGMRRLSSIGAFNALARAEAFRAWAGHSAWKGLWWTQGRVDGGPLLLTCAELPTAEEFGRLLESRLAPEGAPGKG
jgi:type VI secretion system protein ImpM